MSSRTIRLRASAFSRCSAGPARSAPSASSSPPAATTTTRQSSSTTSAGRDVQRRRQQGDLEILNYALTLEYLEADFYKQVIDSGIVKDPKVGSIAKKFGETEQEHVDALKATIKKLGGKPVEAPKTKFEADARQGPHGTSSRPPPTSRTSAPPRTSAQAGNIKNKEVLAAALAIHSVEARHAAALNSLVGRGFGDGKGGLEGALPDGAFAKPMDMKAVLAAVKPFLA